MALITVDFVISAFGLQKRQNGVYAMEIIYSLQLPMIATKQLSVLTGKIGLSLPCLQLEIGHL